METVWLRPAEAADRNAEYIFCGDMGGTNTSFALARVQGGSVRVVGKFLFKTQGIVSLVRAVCEAKEEIGRRRPEIVIRKACVSVAGIVKNNSCVMTNTSWIVSGDEFAAVLKIPVKIINDFTALSYALPLLDTRNPEEITLLCAGESASALSGRIRAVVGAGTGLGVGCLLETDAGFEALASEGGHMDFAPVDETTRELHAWTEKRAGSIPEAELFVSGQGLANIFWFFYEKAGDSANLSEEFRKIAALPDEEKPARIAASASNDRGCADIMKLFVRMYARVAYNVAVTFLPAAGLYLAGGIAGKNEDWFLRDGAFMKSFLVACKPKIRTMLESIPVYIIKDYGVSLTGAANAARYLMKE
jgi:glucokinase